MIRRAYPFRGLAREELEEVLDQLKSQGLLSKANGKFRAGRSGFRYYFTSLSMIPDTKRYRIRDLASRKSVGVLDEEFVAAYAQPEATFVCKGETWKVVETDPDRETILVEPFDDPLGAIPIWEGEMIPVPFEVAQEVGAMRGKIEGGLKSGRGLERVTAELEEAYPISKGAASWIVDEVAELVRAGIPVPTDRAVLVESSGEFIIMHGCFGSLVNQTFAWILAELLSARIGASVQVRSDPYRVAFRFPERAKPDLFKETLEGLLPKHLGSVLELTLKHSAMFQWRLVQVAKRFGAIRRDADLHRINVKRLVKSFQGTPVFREALRETILEKLDTARAAEVLNSLRSGRVSLQLIELPEPTVLAWPILNRLVGGELVVPRRAEQEIMLAVRSRLERQVVRLHCLNCQGWTITTRVGRLPERIICKKCGAGLVTLLPREPKELLTLLRKHARGEKLGREERKRVERAYRVADLVLTHGKRAAVVLSGRGVGPRAAGRILSHGYREERDLHREILRAERIYARTRRFWA
jgi:ATP-dependent Lhr-like helicase